MTWFRTYDDALDNPKVQALPGPIFKHWFNLLCLASQNKPRGSLPPENKIAFRLRLKPCRLSKIIEHLIDSNLLERDSSGTLQVHDWYTRQYVLHAKCTPTVRSFVEKKRLSSSFKSPDTDTDTDKPPIIPLKRGKPKTGVPPDFRVTDEMKKWASKHVPAVDLTEQTEAFLDHHGAKGSVFKDWTLAWHTWMRNSQKWNGNKSDHVARPVDPEEYLREVRGYGNSDRDQRPGVQVKGRGDSEV